MPWRTTALEDLDDDRSGGAFGRGRAVSKASIASQRMTLRCPRSSARSPDSATDLRASACKHAFKIAPPSLGRSIAWLADWGRNPAPNNNRDARLVPTSGEHRDAKWSRTTLISQEQYEMASSRAATLISCSTVNLIASNASRHVLGFLSGACRSFRPANGSPRLQGI